MRSLLEKLQPDQITLDANFIGTVHDHEQTVQAVRQKGRMRRADAGGAGMRSDEAAEESADGGAAAAAAEKPCVKEKRRQRGRSTAMKRW